MFSPFLPFTSGHFHPQWLSHSSPTEPILTLGIFSLKEHAWGKLYFPKLAKAIFLVPCTFPELCHSHTKRWCPFPLPSKPGTKRQQVGCGEVTPCDF